MKGYCIALYKFYLFFAQAVTVDQLVVDTAPFLGKISITNEPFLKVSKFNAHIKYLKRRL
jgi:hypothetical protein